MNEESIKMTVKAFLNERGHNIEDILEDPIVIGSLEYVALLLYVEKKMGIVIEDYIFFGEGIPVNLDEISARMLLAISYPEGEDL